MGEGIEQHFAALVIHLTHSRGQHLNSLKRSQNGDDTRAHVVAQSVEKKVTSRTLAEP